VAELRDLPRLCIESISASERRSQIFDPFRPSINLRDATRLFPTSSDLVYMLVFVF